jgi:hypothetical protein
MAYVQSRGDMLIQHKVYVGAQNLKKHASSYSIFYIIFQNTCVYKFRASIVQGSVLQLLCQYSKLKSIYRRRATIKPCSFRIRFLTVDYLIQLNQF